MIDSSKLLTCAEFVALSARFKAERRANALPHLNERKNALKREIALLRRQRDAAPKHDKQIIENNMSPLSWEYQEICGQVAIIEQEAA